MSKTVLMLGAGASAASEFRLPTMRDFFRTGLHEKPELSEFLSWFYPSKPPEEYNLEDVLAYLSLAQTRLHLWRIKPKRFNLFNQSVIYEELLEFVKNRLITPTDKICELHKSLFLKLNDLDTIISLNYDLIADRVLDELEGPPSPTSSEHRWKRMGKISSLLGRPGHWYEPPPGLLESEQEKGFYLKLHGSLDWLYCPSEGCQNNINYFCVSRGGGLAEGQREGAPCRYCGSALQIAIIPPVATKRLEDRGRMAFLWNIALREITAATDLAVIGLSFAPSDFELRWLVRQAVELRDTELMLNIHIVNKSKEHRDSIKEIFPGSFNVIEYESIDAYTQSYPK